VSATTQERRLARGQQQPGPKKRESKTADLSSREALESSIDFPKQLSRGGDDVVNTDLVHATRVERTGERLRVIYIHARAAFGLVVDRARSFSDESVKVGRLRSI